jgi:hypothetical protein
MLRLYSAIQLQQYIIKICSYLDIKNFSLEFTFLGVLYQPEEVALLNFLIYRNSGRYLSIDRRVFYLKHNVSVTGQNTTQNCDSNINIPL